MGETTGVTPGLPLDMAAIQARAQAALEHRDSVLVESFLIKDTALLCDEVLALRERVRALETAARAAQDLRDHVKALRAMPPLSIGDTPPWHLLDKAKQLNATLDDALARAAVDAAAGAGAEAR